MKLIDADALIKYCDINWIPLNVDAVNAQPTIDPNEQLKWEKDIAVEQLRQLGYGLGEKVKLGKWIGVKNKWGELGIVCSECGAKVPRDEWGTAMTSDYCYLCGAYMRGEEDG